MLENIGCVEKFMNMLSSTDERILEHAVAALRNCARLGLISSFPRLSSTLYALFSLILCFPHFFLPSLPSVSFVDRYLRTERHAFFSLLCLSFSFILCLLF